MKALCTLLVLASLLAAAMAQTSDAPKACPSSLNDTLKKRQAQTQNKKLPVPANLERRTLKVGEVEREFFLHVPAAVKGKPAPAVFALHGGAANSGLQMDYKSDYTKIATVRASSWCIRRA